MTENPVEDTVEITVDDMPVPVDKAEYEADPEGVIAAVRAARAEIRALQESFPEAPDYDQMTAEWGEPS